MAFEVCNEGRPGDTTQELLARFESSVTGHAPDLVILQIGSNDMFYPGHMLSLNSFAENLETLASRILETGASLILFGIPPIYYPFLLENYPETVQSPLPLETRFTLGNDAIRTVAETFAVPWIDLAKLIHPVDETAESMVLNEANSGLRDGMHLTAAGYRIMAEKVFASHQRRCPHAERIVCFGDSITYGVYVKGKGSARTDALTYPGQLAAMLSGI